MFRWQIRLSIIAVCCLLEYLEAHTLVFGYMLNHLIPCQQNPMNSAPCYVIYSLYIGFMLGGLIAVSLLAQVIFTGRWLHKKYMSR